MAAQETPSGPGGDVGAELMIELLPRLTQLSRALNRGRLVEHAMRAAAVGLERPAMSVLLALHVAGQPLRVGEIATRMNVVGPHVTRQVNELERRGLVRRIVDPDDQRARLVEATPEGVAATERYMRAVFGRITEVLAGWSDQDRRDLHRLLARLVDDLTTHLATFDEGRPPFP